MKIINIEKKHLFILTGLLIAGLTYSIIQLTLASPAPPNPGHSWSQIGDFPADCSSGQYVYGLGSTLKCSTPGGGTLVQTTDYCDASDTDGGVTCTVYCPSGYIRSGCSSYCDDDSGTELETCDVRPYGSGCRCGSYSGGTGNVDVKCYIYCLKIQ